MDNFPIHLSCCFILSAAKVGSAAMDSAVGSILQDLIFQSAMHYTSACFTVKESEDRKWPHSTERLLMVKVFTNHSALHITVDKESATLRNGKGKRQGGRER